MISARRRSGSLHSDDSELHEKDYSDVLLILLHFTDKVLLGYTKLREVLFWIAMSSYGK